MHRSSPFHRVQLWNGKCFTKSSLFELGFTLHIGHHGLPCPSNGDGMDLWEDHFDEDDMEPSTDDLILITIKGQSIVIVHSSGIFQHHINWCTCHGAAKKHIQLLREGLFPATTTSPKTAFTFDVLDHFYMDSHVCKTAAMSFFQKLCHFTNNAFPGTVPVCKWVFMHSSECWDFDQDRYRELLHVSRQWWHLLALKCFGYGHEDQQPSHGDLAYFCPACPQPGVNVPKDWDGSANGWVIINMISCTIGCITLYFYQPLLLYSQPLSLWIY